MVRFHHFLLSIAALAMLAAVTAQAQTFDRDVARAFADYRKAWTYLRTKNADMAMLSMESFISKWNEVAGAYKSAPPPPYRNDQRFAESLEGVGTIAREALKLSRTGDLKAAFVMAGHIRPVLYNLHKRNGQRVYSDCVYELGQAMDALFAYRKNLPDLKDDAVMDQILDKTKRLQEAFTRCEIEASPTIKTLPRFRRLFDGATQKLDLLVNDVRRTRDMLLFRRTLGELRSFERLIFYNFG